MQKELNSTDEEKEGQKELNYTFDKKKQDIIKLKECAKIYKEKLLGKRFLVVFNNLNYIEVIFTKKQFKHLTGISSNLSAVAFYNFCIGKKQQNNKTVYISPKDIYTTIEHPRVFAIKKMEVFSLIRDLFEKSSYVLTEISENKRFYKMGLANIQLTILLDDYDDDAKETYIAISLKSESHIKNAKQFDKIEYVFEKTNPYLKYEKMLYPKRIDITSLNKAEHKLNHLIDFSNFTIK